jgi:hypothetical protein
MGRSWICCVFLLIAPGVSMAVSDFEERDLFLEIGLTAGLGYQIGSAPD